MENMDWPPGKIRAAIRDRGMSQKKLSRDAGYSEGAVSGAIVRKYPAGERIIAEFLGVKLQEIWPSRYFPDGRSRSRPAFPVDPTANRYPPHRQKRANT
jgi:Ner family transcriptional regulator